MRQGFLVAVHIDVLAGARKMRAKASRSGVFGSVMPPPVATRGLWLWLARLHRDRLCGFGSASPRRGCIRTHGAAVNETGNSQPDLFTWSPPKRVVSSWLRLLLNGWFSPPLRRIS
jgi:hypothetical protein